MKKKEKNIYIKLGLGATTASVVNNSNFLKDPIATAFKVWDSSGRYVAPNGIN